MLTLLLIAGLWVLNLGISFWNAIAIGHAWVEAKHAGGWARLLTWAGFIMSGSGFTWCYSIVVGIGLYFTGHITLDQAQYFLDAAYVLVIPGILFSGLVIMLDSWARAYRERSLGSFAIGGYNTFAQVYNTYNAVSSFPQALGKVVEGLSKGAKGKNAGYVLLLIIAIVVMLLGYLTTWAIVHRVAASESVETVQARYLAKSANR